MDQINQHSLRTLANTIEGDLHHDKLMRVLYATDASVYRELPLAVAFPKNNADIKKILAFAKTFETSVIPRTAGTSLAGQCVGKGIVVDVSKYMNQILEFNEEQAWVRVQPGVVRNELNQHLKPFGYFFSPITATANRAMIGGMVGNNSSGTTSIEYGTTREHVLELKTILSDGSEALFGELSFREFQDKLNQDNLESQLYHQIYQALKSTDTQEKIIQNLPKSTIHRRNTGYAVDYLLASEPFQNNETPFNFCKLLCGSEGTLAFTTEIKIHLDPLPKPEVLVVATHFEDLQDSLFATQIAMAHKPSACELMDKIILDCTKENREQLKNRFFVEGDPEAILMVEFRANTIDENKQQASDFIAEVQEKSLGYAYPIIEGKETKKVWTLRSAGLGLLANIPGDKKAVACIEDTAVSLDDLPQYIADFTALMEGFRQKSVYYAHAGAGELHLRPILDLKKADDVQAFFDISQASAKLVKKYKGSLSGEHGDGRLRAEFIPMMVGQDMYKLFQEIKNTWDPQNLLNPGKIVDAPPMNTSLRYKTDVPTKEIKTLLDFSKENGIMRAAEKCNGSGDCRKSPEAGGVMCPSYQATKNEKDTTRARANALREFLTQSNQKNLFDQKELKTVMDLCLSCKACAAECPSNVDMASLKAEFLHQYYQSNPIPVRAKAFSYINTFNTIGSKIRPIYNFLLSNPFTSKIQKKILGIAPERSMPTIQKTSLIKWFKKNQKSLHASINKPIKEVYFFCDEFTNFNDANIGIQAIQLLTALQYKVNFIDHYESGRAAISKGLLPKAKKHANHNIKLFYPIITDDIPLIGLEPSAILTFRDEYPRLVDDQLKTKASTLSSQVFIIDEFIASEMKSGNITSELFSKETKQIVFHGHCHQKSNSDVQDSIWMLSLPENYSVEMIPSGCCGMAGSFGFEKEHYEVSQQIGELVLFPAIRNTNSETTLAATGTSCRHQIKDALSKKALHPVEILFEALIK